MDPRPGPAEVLRRITAPPSSHDRRRMAAVVISLAVGIVLLGVKFLAYRLTGSVALLSDALESIVNVVAATFALGGIAYAGRPADANHPYGHGKIEFFSAAFEGGLIAFAAVLIVYTAVQGFVEKAPLHQLDLGLVISFGAGLANLALGWFLIATGRRLSSLTLVADGQHVLTDFWTTAGVLAGLVLVRFTGIQWLDPLVAALVGLNLARTGIRLVRQSAGGLLDEIDPSLLQRLAVAFNATRFTGIIHIHHLRAIRSGRFTHVDAHVVVPEFWSVDQAHDAIYRFAAGVMETCRTEGELALHTDPCRQAFCKDCDLSPCAIRVAPLESRRPFMVPEMVGPDEYTGDPRD